jgi:hypothetical protein
LFGILGQLRVRERRKDICEVIRGDAGAGIGDMHFNRDPPTASGGSEQSGGAGEPHAVVDPVWYRPRCSRCPRSCGSSHHRAQCITFHFPKREVRSLHRNDRHNFQMSSRPLLCEFDGIG